MPLRPDSVLGRALSATRAQAVVFDAILTRGTQRLVNATNERWDRTAPDLAKLATAVGMVLNVVVFGLAPELMPVNAVAGVCWAGFTWYKHKEAYSLRLQLLSRWAANSVPGLLLRLHSFYAFLLFTGLALGLILREGLTAFTAYMSLWAVIDGLMTLVFYLDTTTPPPPSRRTCVGRAGVGA